MSKGLEALRRINIHLPRYDETQEKEFSEYVSTIEKELNILVVLKRLNLIDIDLIRDMFEQGEISVDEFNDLISYFS